MIYIEDYTDAIEFLEDAFDQETEFTYAEILSISSKQDYSEVTKYLHDLVTYRNFNKMKTGCDIFYSNIKTSDRTSLLNNLIELESMERTWSSWFDNDHDQQNRAHYMSLKSHIMRLKKELGIEK